MMPQLDQFTYLVKFFPILVLLYVLLRKTYGQHWPRLVRVTDLLMRVFFTMTILKAWIAPLFHSWLSVGFSWALLSVPLVSAGSILISSGFARTMLCLNNIMYFSGGLGPLMAGHSLVKISSGFARTMLCRNLPFSTLSFDSSSPPAPSRIPRSDMASSSSSGWDSKENVEAIERLGAPGWPTENECASLASPAAWWSQGEDAAVPTMEFEEENYDIFTADLDTVEVWHGLFETLLSISFWEHHLQIAKEQLQSLYETNDLNPLQKAKNIELAKQALYDVERRLAEQHNERNGHILEIVSVVQSYRADKR